jgi:hypothetical protein
MQSSHVRLCEVQADSLDDAWCQMQAERWSPNGEARPLLERLGLSHTSMSVGDVILDEDGIHWECLDLACGLGWSGANWRGGYGRCLLRRRGGQRLDRRVEQRIGAFVWVFVLWLR